MLEEKALAEGSYAIENLDLLVGDVLSNKPSIVSIEEPAQVLPSEQSGPYVLMALRFGPRLLPEPDPKYGPLEEQQRLIALWQAAWARNEHPNYPSIEEMVLKANPNVGSEKNFHTSRELNKKGIANVDFNEVSSIRQQFSYSIWEIEPVRSPMSHFLEDAQFLEWALTQGIRVYGFTYVGEAKDIVNVYQHANSMIGDEWKIKTEVSWSIHPQVHICIFALNSDGKPALWTKDNNSAILHGTGIFQRRIDGLKDRAEAEGAIVWRSCFPDDNRGDLYYKSKVFKKWAGREMQDCSLDYLPYMLYKFWVEGHSKVFIKHTDPKVGVWLFDLPSQEAMGPTGIPLTPMDIFNLFLKENERDVPSIFTCVGKNGYPSFMVQGYVHFQYEYRFWVSRGRVIAGTPVRRHDTPLADAKWNAALENENYRWKNIGAGAEVGVKQGRFHPYMCIDREEDGPHLARARVAEYARVARVIVRDLLRSNVYVGSEYVLDLGTDKRTGKIIPVELNGFNHAGSYGVNIRTVWQPILRIAQKHCEQIKYQVDNFNFWLGE